MKKFKYIAIPLAIQLLLAGCTIANEPEVGTPDITQEQGIVLVADALNSAQSRVVYTETETQIELAWNDGVDADQITIYDSNTRNRVCDYKVSSIADDGKATFVKVEASGDDLIDGGSYVAVYPQCDFVTLEERETYTTSNITQSQVTDNNFEHLSSNSYMTTAEFEVGTMMKFAHEMSMMTVKFTTPSPTTPTQLNLIDCSVNYVLNLSSFSASTSHTARLMIRPSVDASSRNVRLEIAGSEIDALRQSKKKFVAGVNYIWSITKKQMSAESPSDVESLLGSDKADGASTEVDVKVEGDDNTIYIPGDTKADDVTLKVNDSITELEIKAVDGEGGEKYDDPLVVNCPNASDAILAVDTPDATVTLGSGSYKKVTAKTAPTTFVVAVGVTIGDLIIEGGNVEVYGNVTGSITRSVDNSDAQTIVRVFGEGTIGTLGDGVVKYINVESIELNKTSATLKIDEMEYLAATAHPYDATNKAIHWYSSNDDIATVEATSGVVVGRSAGKTTINAISDDGSIKGVCTITVLAEESTEGGLGNIEVEEW